MASMALVVLTALAAPACAPINPAALELSTAVARATCADPALARLRATVAQASALRDERDAAFRPTLSARATPTASTQRGDGANVTSAVAGASLLWQHTLADGGARRARSDQAGELAAASQADLLAQTLSVQRDIVGAWADWRDALAALESANAAVASSQQSLAAADARFRAGSAARVDALAAKSGLAVAERSRIDAEAALDRTRLALAQRLALDSDASLRPAGADASLLGANIDTDSALLAAHPQAAAQRARMAAARAQVEAARSEDRATLAASASVGPQTSRANTTGRWDTRTQAVAEAGLTWSMPLSDGGARQARIAQALAAADVEQARLAEVERALSEALAQARAAVRSAAAQAAAATVAFEAAAESEAAQRARYQAGAGTLADWLNAQNELASSRRQALQARQQRLRAEVQLLAASGRALP